MTVNKFIFEKLMHWLGLVFYKIDSHDVNTLFYALSYLNFVKYVSMKPIVVAEKHERRKMIVTWKLFKSWKR